MIHPIRQVRVRLGTHRFAAAGGMRAVDTGATLTPAACAWLKQNGYAAAIRYLGRMSRAEADMIRASGLDIIGVLEHNGNGGYAGYDYGAQCMQDAINGTRAAGGPQGGIVLWIAEYDFDASNVGAAQPFVNGAYDRAHANGYLAGHYGPWGLLRQLGKIDASWQTMSTGFFGNGYTTACTMSQHFPYVYPGGIQCDQDDIHDPAHAGLWHGSAPPPVPAYHPSGGQEDRSKVALVTRPIGRGVDAVVVGVDGNVWHASGDSAITLQNAGWENLGSPFGAKSVSGGWTADGSQFVVACHGNDNGMWIKFWDSHLGWTPNWTKQSTGVLAP